MTVLYPAPVPDPYYQGPAGLWMRTVALLAGMNIEVSDHVDGPVEPDTDSRDIWLHPGMAMRTAGFWVGAAMFSIEHPEYAPEFEHRPRRPLAEVTPIRRRPR